MNFDSILYSTKDEIATITLNVPSKFNVFNETMSRNILAALEVAEEDDNIKVIIINANGKAFSGGGDIGEMLKAMEEGRVVFGTTADLISQISRNIIKSKKPVIASVAGAVAGAAFNIALACDFCIAADNAKFMQSFVNIGVIPDAGGLYLLTRAVGINKARHLTMLGTPVTAEEGKDLGFVYQVCLMEDLAPETEKLAVQLAQGPAKSYELIKSLVYASQFDTYERYTEKEIASQVACGYTQDYKEGIRAFYEKRIPVFRGK